MLNLLSVLSVGAALALSACRSEPAPADQKGAASKPAVTPSAVSVEAESQAGAPNNEGELNERANLPNRAGAGFEDAAAKEVARIGLDGDRAAEAAPPPEQALTPTTSARPTTDRGVAKPNKPRAAGLGAGDTSDHLSKVGGGLSRNTPSAPKTENKPQDEPARRPTSKTVDEDTLRENSKKSKSKTPGKSTADAPGDPAFADAQGLLTRLGQLEGELRNAGVAIPSDMLDAQGNAASGPSAGEKGDKGAEQAPIDCVQVCELSEAICDLEIRICALSRAHPEDDRYQNACERAGDDCRAGSEVCNVCSVDSD